MIAARRILVLLGAAVVLASCAADGTRNVAPGLLADIAAVSAGAEPRPIGGLTTAGQPDEGALRAFAEAGYVAVIDLRAADEDRGMPDEPGAVAALGLDYVAMPIGSAEEINYDAARQLDAIIQAYDGPVLVHCASSNRVGALLALRESLHGADDKAALAYGKAAGLTRLEPRVREVLEQQ